MDGFLNLGKFKKIDYFVSNLLIMRLQEVVFMSMKNTQSK